MKPYSITQFKGIAPLYGDALPKGMATIAENVDLTNGKIKILPESRRAMPENLYSGQSLSWPINDLEIEIFLEDGVLKKRVGSSEADLGQDPPAVPTVTSLTTRFDLRNKPVYKWTASGSGTGEWYCELRAGGDPSLAEPDNIRTSSEGLYTRASAGSLTVGQWDYADNDSLGYSTVYIRIVKSVNPDTVTSLAIYHEMNTGNVSGDVSYIITSRRDVGGHIDESGPSAITGPTLFLGDKIQITLPAVTEPSITHHLIYRLSGTSDFLLVAEVEAATLVYEDNALSASLGVACRTYYTSRQDNDITFAKPPSGVEGIATKLYAGMVLFWIGSTLYWTEPGYPDACPSVYNLNLPSKIKKVLPFSGAVAVLTEDYPFRIDGTNPETLQPSDAIGQEPCKSSAAYPTSSGVVYLSDSGIVNFNLVECKVLTDPYFGEEWFTQNIDPDTAEIVENDGIFYLKHSGGIVAADARSGKMIFFTINSTAPTTWTWRSGDILGDSDENDFAIIRVTGEGEITATAYVDGVQVATKQMYLNSMIRHRTLRIDPENTGRALQIEFVGGEDDEVTEVAVGWE